ncbi:TetR family transcriptional regulator C-terminal domain-containing protein [Streptomyces sp. NPDC086554]|uniref:TetR family transcriptional regulator C-terminal domain-containing protein n=1 Tax=Streptomyces sp. NPDC086554 TaxID=3154864 RepID=UPI00343C0D10
MRGSTTSSTYSLSGPTRSRSSAKSRAAAAKSSRSAWFVPRGGKSTSVGHILYYFGSKDRLLLEALRWSEAALAEERRALLAGRTAPELDHGWQQDLEALVAQGADRGVLTADDAAGRAGELLALLDGLSTRVVLGQRGADRGGALASARSTAERLIGRPEPTGA